MTKEEFLQSQWDTIDSMPLDKLREYAKRLDVSAQTYFHNWQESVAEINRLQTIVQQSLSGSDYAEE